MEHNLNKIQYPCPTNALLSYLGYQDPRLTTIQECMMCHKHLTCDIYATMLDEVNDMK